MSSPLKNVLVQEVEAAIAQALQALSAGQAFIVLISEMAQKNRLDGRLGGVPCQGATS